MLLPNLATQLPPPGVVQPSADAGLFSLMHLLLLLAALTALVLPQTTRSQPTTKAADNAELKALFDADQGDRQGAMGHDVAEQDRQRRGRVREIIDAGDMRTAADHFHAAMVFQHSDSPDDYKLAHDLAKKAGELDPSHRAARWLSAAAMDRYLLSVGKPQIYGTQYMIVQDVWVLQRMDESAVSDQERQALGVPTLAAAKDRVRQRNAERGVTDEDNRRIDELFVEFITEQVQGGTRGSQTLSPRMREIGAEAQKIVEAGEAKTVRDLYESAAMIEPFAETVEQRKQVLALLEQARAAAPDDERLNVPHARAVDKLRVAEGKGQWYGTFATRPEESASGRWEPPTIDPESTVTDEERQKLRIPPLAEWASVVEQLNRQLDEERATTRPEN